MMMTVAVTPQDIRPRARRSSRVLDLLTLFGA